MSENILISLPMEILLNICSFLKLSDLLNMMLTCKTIKNMLISENALWRLMSHKKFIFIKNKRYGFKIDKIECAKSCSDSNLIKGKKSFYFSDKNYCWYNQCRIFHNWCLGIYKKKVIIQHRINYMPWLHFSNSEYLLLSVGPELKCYVLERRGVVRNSLAWSLEVPTVKRFDVRTNDISRFIVKDNVIVCGNRDGCVSVYQMNHNQYKPHLLVHIKDCHENGLEEVSAVEKLGNTVVTVSNKSDSICFWQWSNEDNYCSKLDYAEFSKVRHVNEYHLPNDTCCKSIAANKAEDTLAIGPTGYDKPMILDVNTGNLIMCTTSINLAKVIRDIHWLNEQSVAYVTHSGELQVYDTRCSNVVYQTTDPFMSSLYCLKTDGNNTIVTGTSEYARCVLYDLRSKYHVQMFFTQKKPSPVYCLDFDSTKLIAAADRGVANIDFNVKSSSTARNYSQRFEFVKR